jgi:hypothetical protein
MSRNRRIRTRELLRNFRSLKELLLSGSIQHLVIDVGNEQELELSLRGHTNTGEHLAHLLTETKKPHRISRTNVIEELLQ